MPLKLEQCERHAERMGLRVEVVSCGTYKVTDPDSGATAQAETLIKLAGLLCAIEFEASKQD